MAFCIVVMPGTYAFSQTGKSKAKAPKDTTQMVKHSGDEKAGGKQNQKEMDKKEKA
jgi:hypothetical protein